MATRFPSSSLLFYHLTGPATTATSSCRPPKRTMMPARHWHRWLTLSTTSAVLRRHFLGQSADNRHFPCGTPNHLRQRRGGLSMQLPDDGWRMPPSREGIRRPSPAIVLHDRMTLDNSVAVFRHQTVLFVTVPRMVDMYPRPILASRERIR